MLRFCKGFSLVLAMVCGLIMLPVDAHAVTFVNGSFEFASKDPGDFITLPDGSTVIDGWTVGGQIDYIGTHWVAANGTRSLDMNGLAEGSISQQIKGLTKGQQYTIQFSLAGNPDSKTPPERKLDVMVGLDSASYTFTIAGGTTSAMGWIVHSLVFVAQDTTALLTFASAVSGFYGPALDNVSIAATPLPAALPLFLSVLGLFGWFSWLKGARESTA